MVLSSRDVTESEVEINAELDLTLHCLVFGVDSIGI